MDRCCSPCQSIVACAGANMCLIEARRYQHAAPLCENHRPDGGVRAMCLVCAIERLQSALSRIDYLCMEPNEMGVSDYDCHYDEEAVVRRVEAALKQQSPKDSKC